MDQLAQRFKPTLVSISRTFTTFDKIEKEEIPLVGGFQKLFDDFLNEAYVDVPNNIKKMGFTMSFFDTVSAFFFLSILEEDDDVYQSAKDFFVEKKFKGILCSNKPTLYKQAVKIIMSNGNTAKYKMGYILLEESSVTPMVAFEG